MDEDAAAEASRRRANIRYLLNRWDLLGVADLVEDEYDCMVTPLWNVLRRSASPAEVSEFLWYEIEGHFGLDPSVHEIDQFANRLVALAAAWSFADLHGTMPPPAEFEL